ncbi:hypothetical protein NDU88_001967, partial [Pleurodeles waltl]
MGRGPGPPPVPGPLWGAGSAGDVGGCFNYSPGRVAIEPSAGEENKQVDTSGAGGT